MFRAAITMLVMGALVATLGTLVLVVGLVYPSRRLFASSAGLWARTVLVLSGTRLTVAGRERLNANRPHFFMANHQSALDIPILVAALNGDVRFMAKDTLFRIPIFGWLLWRYGFAAINRSHARVTARALERMIDRLHQYPISFAVFPEGTRTRDGALLPFRRGTMKVGQRSGLPIVPVTIDGSLHVHHRDHFAAKPGPVRLVFHEPIPAGEVAAMSAADLHQRVVGVIAESLGQPARAAHADELCVGTEALS